MPAIETKKLLRRFGGFVGAEVGSMDRNVDSNSVAP